MRTLQEQKRGGSKLGLTAVVFSTLGLFHGCSSPQPDPDAGVIDAAPQGGRISLSWSVKNQDDTLGCSDVGASAVSARLTPIDGLRGQVEAFPCSAGGGESGRIPPGNYNLSLDLRAPGSISLLQEPLAVGTIAIVAEETLDVGSHVFEVEPIGTFDFRIAAEEVSENCTAAAQGGAGIIAMSLELQSDGACVPTIFAIGPDTQGQGAGVYENDCDVVTAAPCIESDQAVSVTDAPSGPLLLSIGASIEGPTPCYGRVTTFTQPGAGRTKSLGTLEMPLEYSAACDPNFEPPDAGPDADASVPDAGMSGL